MDEKTLEKLMTYFKNDRWLTGALGATIDDGADGYGVCSMEIKPEHTNANGVVQGGAIVTLADGAFAMACNFGHIINEEKKLSVGQSMTVSFLTPPKGTRLIATAKSLHRGHRIGVYNIEVKDNLGTLVATLSGNSYTIDIK
jgi:acyl-CoA thioesterase